MFKQFFIAATLALVVSTGVDAYTLNHPCLLHTEDDFEYVRQHITEEPYASAFTKLKNSPYCKLTYSPSPVEYLARLDANNWSQLNWRWEDAGIADLWYSGIHNNYTQFMRDAAAAYQLALRYRLDGNTQAANTAKNIMVKWSDKNKGILVNSKGEIIDPNERLMMFQPYQMAVAAEMLRDYNNWGTTAEFKKVVNWLDNAFYWVAKEQIDLQNRTGGGHYWQNWDLASMTTILALGILTDNDAYITEALDYYKGKGGGPGNILKGVPYLHEDPDSDEMLGQGNELGRDQGHNTLCAAVLGTFCQMALAIGEDLYAYDDYRALKFAEYVAKYNLAKESLYPNPMDNFSAMRAGDSDSDFVYAHSSFPYKSYTYGDGGTMTEPSQASRGTVRPGWDYWVGYANDHGLSAIYSTEMAERIRPDGGGGQYSPNSGGFDQIGFSTIMGYRPFKVDAEASEANFECVADTWIRQDSPALNNGGSPKIELRKISVKDDNDNIIGANYHLGLISFKYSLPQNKNVERAVLHMVTERVKGNPVDVYAYTNIFDEDKANWNTEQRFVNLSQEPVVTFTAAGQKNKAIYDGGIDADKRTLDYWTNEIDITDYVKTLDADTKRVSFLLKQESNEQVCFFAKDNQGQQKAFNNTDDVTDFVSTQLKPYLKVYYEVSKDETTGLQLPEDENAKTIYFNIQGIRVSNPVPGEIYIIKKGSKVTKTIFKS